MPKIKEGIYIHRITGKEYNVTKSDNLYKVESTDKGNIRYITESELLSKFKIKE